MTMKILFLTVFLLFAASVDAQELLLAQTSPPRLEWSYQAAPLSCATATPSATVRTRPSTTSTTYATVATLPIPNPPPTTVTYNLPSTANNLFYSVTTACGTSNEVQYVALTPPPTDPTIDQRLTAVETKNAAQDLALSSLASKDMAHDTSIGTLGSQLVNAESRIVAGETKNATQDAALSGLAARVTALENPPPPPAPTSNLSVKELNVDQVEITGLNCASLKTTGTGLKRVVTCQH